MFGSWSPWNQQLEQLHQQKQLEQITPSSTVGTPTASNESPFFEKDALHHTRESLSATTRTTTASAVTAKALPTPLTPERTVSEFEDLPLHEHSDLIIMDAGTDNTTNQGPDFSHVDAAEKVYDVAKGVWAWGKGVIVVGTFMGVAEGVAGKVVDMVSPGTSLQDVDGGITSHLTGLDNSVLNPAIARLAEALLGAVGKTSEVVQPIIATLLNPMALLRAGDSTSETPELTGAEASASGGGGAAGGVEGKKEGKVRYVPISGGAPPQTVR